jgi:hypothetical protein
MGRAKGTKNKIQSSIVYPRKCLQCDYLSNNPSMYHYHAKTHDQIPNGQLCNHGCGRDAKYKGTGGIYRCEAVSQQCTAYIKIHSDRVKAQWDSNDWSDRKQHATHTLRMFCQTPDGIEKSKSAKRIKFKYLSEEVHKEYRHYARYIRKHAQLWAKAQGYNIGKLTYHVDHRFSILDGFHANVPETIMNHPANLEILTASQNASKGAKSSMTLEQLYEAISAVDLV